MPKFELKPLPFPPGKRENKFRPSPKDYETLLDKDQLPIPKEKKFLPRRENLRRLRKLREQLEEKDKQSALFNKTKK